MNSWRKKLSNPVFVVDGSYEQYVRDVGEPERVEQVRNVSGEVERVSLSMPVQSQDSQDGDGEVLGGEELSPEGLRFVKSYRGGEVELPVVAEGKVDDAVDMNEILGALNSSGDSSTAVVKDLITVSEKSDILAVAVKSVIPNPKAFSRLLFRAEYNGHVGFPDSCGFLKRVAVYQYVHGMAKKGKLNRAVMVKEALNVEVNKEFEIDKKRAMRGALG